MILGDKLNPPCGRHVETAAVGDDADDGTTPKRQIDGPQTISGSIRRDEKGSSQQCLIVIPAAQHRAVGKTSSSDPNDPTLRAAIIQGSLDEVNKRQERRRPGVTANAVVMVGDG